MIEVAAGWCGLRDRMTWEALSDRGSLAFLRWELGQFCLSCSVNNTSKQQWLKLIVRLAVVEQAGWGWGGVVNDSHSDVRVQSAPRWRMLSEETRKVFINLT